MESRNKILLAIVAILIVIKFALVPLLSWQDQQVAEIERLNQQLQKGLHLLHNRQQLDAEYAHIAKIDKALSDKMLFAASSTTALQLNLQKLLDSWLAKYNLNAQNTNWQAPYQRQYFIEHRIELNLTGSFKDLALFILQVEQYSPKITVLEVHSLVSRMDPKNKKLGRFNGNMVLSVWQQPGDGQ